MISPMILLHKVPPVSALLKATAKSGGTASFQKLHALFNKGEADKNVYDTLEKAALELADFGTAIYSVVLAKRDGLPGSGFFSLYRIHRNDEFQLIAGSSIEQVLSPVQMTEMVMLERKRVYAHAG